MLEQFFSSMCTPAQLYVALSAVSVAVAFVATFRVFDALVGAITALLWGAFLNYICQTGYPNVAWVVLVVPWIMLLAGGSEIASYVV
jgi:hypothetical protein